MASDGCSIRERDSYSGGLVGRTNDYTQITKVEKELISIYRLTERNTEADEAERRLLTLNEVVQ